VGDESSAAVAEPVVAPEKEKESKNEKRERRQPPYHVILWDDDDHSFAFVITMLQVLFGHPVEMGMKLAKEVNTAGRVIVFTTTLERAELKRDQIHAYGKDDLIDGCKGSMKATIEPSE
jgi:ATP-dependent Clp protease adaptor protein ClpS